MFQHRGAGGRWQMADGRWQVWWLFERSRFRPWWNGGRATRQPGATFCRSRIAQFGKVRLDYSLLLAVVCLGEPRARPFPFPSIAFSSFSCTPNLEHLLRCTSAPAHDTTPHHRSLAGTCSCAPLTQLGYFACLRRPCPSAPARVRLCTPCVRAALRCPPRRLLQPPPPPVLPALA